jgi:hypothetical protein
MLVAEKLMELEIISLNKIRQSHENNIYMFSLILGANKLGKLGHQSKRGDFCGRLEKMERGKERAIELVNMIKVHYKHA